MGLGLIASIIVGGLAGWIGWQYEDAADTMLPALLITLLLSFPIGVAAAVYLEEFAPRNRMTDLIEVNVNNLAAVPSIVFGLLGLAIFINMFGLPRSAHPFGQDCVTSSPCKTLISPIRRTGALPRMKANSAGDGAAAGADMATACASCAATIRTVTARSRRSNSPTR